jgi:hypothetical protein
MHLEPRASRASRVSRVYWTSRVNSHAMHLVPRASRVNSHAMHLVPRASRASRVTSHAVHLVSRAVFIIKRSTIFNVSYYGLGR